MASTAPSSAARNRPRGPTWRHVTVAVVALLGGIAIGATASTLVPPGGFDRAARARHALATDTAGGLTRAIAAADNTPDLVAVGALARVLLWLDHGGADVERVAAERALHGASPAVRCAPEALYARALLATLPPALRPVVDNDLDADLRKVPAPAAAWVELARAVRAEEPERRQALERAAFSSASSPHASNALARWLLATNELAGARAVVERLLQQSPDHVGAIVTSLVIGVRSDALSTMSNTLTSPRRAGPPRARLDEARARALLDRGLDPRDEDTLVLGLWFAALARGTDIDTGLLARTTGMVARSAERAERAIELALLDGELELASSLVAALPQTTTRPGVLVDAARVRFARAIPEPERRATARAQAVDAAGVGRVDAAGVQLALGRIAFPAAWEAGPPASSSSTVRGLPWVVQPDPAFFPEARFSPLALSSTTDGLDEKLLRAEALGLAERALERSDLPRARAAVAQVTSRWPDDLDVRLVDAEVAAREGDRARVKTSLGPLLDDADGPAAQLAVARLALDVDDLVGCRRALNAFFKPGLTSAKAMALLANLEARGGDLVAAKKALGEARQLGIGDDELALRAAVLVGRVEDATGARAAADVLRTRTVGGAEVDGGDVIGAWIAEARYRAGEQPRAEAALRAIVAAQPLLGDAHLFLARTIAFDAARSSEALDAATRATELIEHGPLLDEARQLVASLKRP